MNKIETPIYEDYNLSKLDFENYEVIKKLMPEYKAWKGMKSRCYSPSTVNIGKYREHQITVCDEWLHDFGRFYKDMGPKPGSKYSLDRIDNNKGYFANNCRWTTHDVQVKNRGSFNLVFTYQGESLVLKDWARKLGIKYSTLYQRIYRDKMNFESAIEDDPYNRLIEINGQRKILKDWCKIYNRKYMTITCRIYRGWDKVKAILTPTKETYIEKNERIL